MKLYETIAAALLMSAMMVTLSACENDGPMEDTGESIDDSFDEAGDAIDDAAD